MEDDIRQLMMPDIDFHRTSTRKITLKLVPPTLDIITTFFQTHDDASYSTLKDA